MNRRGYSLPELLLIVVILGILAAISMPGIARLGRAIRLEGSAQALVGDLNRARTDAIRRNATVLVTLDRPAGYWVQNNGLRSLDEEVAFTPGSPDTVRFTAFGTSETGRRIFTIQLGESQKRVVVEAAGQARVE